MIKPLLQRNQSWRTNQNWINIIPQKYLNLHTTFFTNPDLEPLSTLGLERQCAGAVQYFKITNVKPTLLASIRSRSHSNKSKDDTNKEDCKESAEWEVFCSAITEARTWLLESRFGDWSGGENKRWGGNRDNTKERDEKAKNIEIHIIDLLVRIGDVACHGSKSEKAIRGKFNVRNSEAWSPFIPSSILDF